MHVVFLYFSNIPTIHFLINEDCQVTSCYRKCWGKNGILQSVLVNPMGLQQSRSSCRLLQNGEEKIKQNPCSVSIKCSLAIVSTVFKETS